jgi:molybdenum cofactor cytidylyltransferase
VVDVQACVILAAGSSARFGSNKLLHVMPDGRNLLTTTVSKYRSVFEKVVVVVRSLDSLVVDALEPLKVSTVVCEDSAQGMSQSICCGVKAVEHADSILIALADMPFVRISTIALLREVMTPDGIVAPVHCGKRGNPVGFGQTFLNGCWNLKVMLGHGVCFKKVVLAS